MQVQGKAEICERVYALSYTAAQLAVWLLTISVMWRFIVGEFRHPIYLLGVLIDYLGIERLSGYWMEKPPSWGDGIFVLFQWPAYYVTGLGVYTLAFLIISGVFHSVHRLMTANKKTDPARK